jgi:hypothetical protein
MEGYDMPKRIQRKRTKDWRMPENAVYVGRPSKWGNPFRVGIISDFGDVPDAETAVMFFRAWINKGLQRERIVRELRGKDLACWCQIEKPCHADVLLELANK